MTIHIGVDASYSHPDNGMARDDMLAALTVADQLDEVIIFRSTGSWSKRWIEAGRFPTKNFHVKGKSSDWGPQAGFVPYNGVYSKVGYDLTKANAGTKANDDGLVHHFAGKTQLTLTRAELDKQCTVTAGNPPRLAIHKRELVKGTQDLFLWAKCSGKNPSDVAREVAFLARYLEKGPSYKIFVYPGTVTSTYNELAKSTVLARPLEVMTSTETGAGNVPMTGDYDLMAVCPRWDDYGRQSMKEITKPGLNFANKGLQPGLSFAAGARLDQVLDMRSNTGARPAGGDTTKTFQGLTKKDGGKLNEHADMGNLTPRILRCINHLNAAMGAVGERSPFRRVHHNAESHRNHIFAALTKSEMETGDGFPLTVFQPKCLQAGAMRRYGDVATLESLTEFREYATSLNQAGYFVPRNWTWAMSIRDGFR